MIGRKIFEYELDVTGVEDTGVSLPDIISGNANIPASGVRVDVAFAGQVSGEIVGKVHGVDYIRFYPDGSIVLDIRAMIETASGDRIAISADGRAVLNDTRNAADLRENIHLNTVAADYQWLNTRQVWGVGTVDFSRGKIFIQSYVQ